MRDQKGYSLIEILSVAVIIALILSTVAFAALKEIDRARGSTLISEARMTMYAARAVMLETNASLREIYDEDYEAGLTGTVSDASLPIQTTLSERITALLSPDIVLSKTPGDGAARASFEVKDGVIINMSYETDIGERRYIVTISEGGEAEVTRVK